MTFVAEHIHINEYEPLALRQMQMKFEVAWRMHGGGSTKLGSFHCVNTKCSCLSLHSLKTLWIAHLIVCGSIFSIAFTLLSTIYLLHKQLITHCSTFSSWHINYHRLKFIYTHTRCDGIRISKPRTTPKKIIIVSHNYIESNGKTKKKTRKMKIKEAEIGFALKLETRRQTHSTAKHSTPLHWQWHFCQIHIQRVRYVIPYFSVLFI